MRISKVEKLGTEIINDVCAIGMTYEEVATTFDVVLAAFESMLTREAIVECLKPDVVSEAEQILSEFSE